MLTISPTLTPITYDIKIDQIVIEKVILPANPGMVSATAAPAKVRTIN